MRAKEAKVRRAPEEERIRTSSRGLEKASKDRKEPRGPLRPMAGEVECNTLDWWWRVAECVDGEEGDEGKEQKQQRARACTTNSPASLASWTGVARAQFPATRAAPRAARHRPACLPAQNPLIRTALAPLDSIELPLQCK